ncbi:isochorismatase family cysteine hydrolase [Pseudoalteromonas neustonica]|uniref:Isochorismatase family cysteine hydrolase n=1 Tax=Pseudoalteromonas neustonica TaxID=1840331 RepID=A0ABU9TZF7_9GAMM
MTSTALILIDFINEIVSEKGELSSKGYTAFINKHDTDIKVARLLDHARTQQWQVFHVGVGFSEDYNECSLSSPLFSGAQKANVLKRGSWGCDFADFSTPKDNEIKITKHRVSAFFNTRLDCLLSSNKISHVVIAGCSTDLSVQSTARDAHDRDFKVTVVIDACAAANDSDHNNSIPVLNKISDVIETNELLF